MKYLSGTFFKKKSKFSVGEYTGEYNYSFSFIEKWDVDNNCVFVKTECLPELISKVELGKIFLPNDITLITHNSDINISELIASIIFDQLPSVSHWFAQNLNTTHPKLSPIPIGIANPKWAHGNEERFTKIILEKNIKDNLVYSNFNIATNPRERTYCQNQISKNTNSAYPNQGIVKHNEFVNNTQEQYLRNIAKSFFVISPNGNGIDCHRHWESLYMGSIPIVTKSVMIEKFKQMGIPFLMIDDWADFKNIELTEALYNDLWNGFDASRLSWDFFIKGESFQKHLK